MLFSSFGHICSCPAEIPLVPLIKGLSRRPTGFLSGHSPHFLGDCVQSSWSATSEGCMTQGKKALMRLSISRCLHGGLKPRGRATQGTALSHPVVCDGVSSPTLTPTVLVCLAAVHKLHLGPADYWIGCTWQLLLEPKKKSLFMGRGNCRTYCTNTVEILSYWLSDVFFSVLNTFNMLKIVFVCLQEWKISCHATTSFTASM